MRIFRNKPFTRFALKAHLGDHILHEAIANAEKGLIAADLGGGVIKQRVARPGEGKSGGFRVLIVFKKRERAFFVYGFAKNEKENIGKDDLAALKKLASELLACDDKAITRLLATGVLTEVTRNEERIP